MSISRRQVVRVGIFGGLMGALSFINSGCGGNMIDDTAKMDPAKEKELADQRKATEEFYASKKKK